MPVAVIPADNLPMFLNRVAKLAAYTLTDSEHDAIRFGLRDTDETKDKWYDYPILGEARIDLAFANGSDEKNITIRYDADAAVRAMIDHLVIILQHYHPDPKACRLPKLIEKAFPTDAALAGNRVVACDDKHLAQCLECREVRSNFQGKRWTELVARNGRPPRSAAGPGFLTQDARTYFFPAYLIAAARDRDPEWLEIARSGGISEERFTPLQRRIAEFVADLTDGHHAS